MSITARVGRALEVFFMVALMGCTPVNGSASKPGGARERRMDLWTVVAELGRKMPLSKQKLEESIPTTWALKERTPYLAHWLGGKVQLDDGVEIASVSLVLDRHEQFDDTSGVTLELAGKCITLADVVAKYERLLITDVPRGRSLEELTIHTAFESWGRLSFAFKAARPDCLFAVSFNPPG